MFCRCCGSTIEEDSLFCRVCGCRQDDVVQDLSSSNKSETNGFCPACNAELDSDSVFCSKCGTCLVDSSIDNSEQPLISTPKASSQVEGMASTSSCNTASTPSNTVATEKTRSSDDSRSQEDNTGDRHASNNNQPSLLDAGVVFLYIEMAAFAILGLVAPVIVLIVFAPGTIIGKALSFAMCGLPFLSTDYGLYVIIFWLSVGCLYILVLILDGSFTAGAKILLGLGTVLLFLLAYYLFGVPLMNYLWDVRFTFGI